MVCLRRKLMRHELCALAEGLPVQENRLHNLAGDAPDA